jgi:hypothetical protein
MISNDLNLNNALCYARNALGDRLTDEAKTSLKEALVALEQAIKRNRVIDMHTPVKVLRENGQAYSATVNALHFTGSAFFFRVADLTAWFRADEEGKTWFWND